MLTEEIATVLHRQEQEPLSPRQQQFMRYRYPESRSNLENLLASAEASLNADRAKASQASQHHYSA